MLNAGSIFSNVSYYLVGLSFDLSLPPFQSNFHYVDPFLFYHSGDEPLGSFLTKMIPKGILIVALLFSQPRDNNTHGSTKLAKGVLVFICFSELLLPFLFHFSVQHKLQNVQY